MRFTYGKLVTTGFLTRGPYMKPELWIPTFYWRLVSLCLFIYYSYSFCERKRNIQIGMSLIDPFHNLKGFGNFLLKLNALKYPCMHFMNVHFESEVESTRSQEFLLGFFAFSIVQRCFLSSLFMLLFFSYYLTPSLFLFLSHFKGLLIEMCWSNWNVVPWRITVRHCNLWTS